MGWWWWWKLMEIVGNWWHEDEEEDDDDDDALVNYQRFGMDASTTNSNITMENCLVVEELLLNIVIFHTIYTYNSYVRLPGSRFEDPFILPSLGSYYHDPNVYMDRILKPSSKTHICTSRLFHKWIMKSWYLGKSIFQWILKLKYHITNIIYIYYMDCNPYNQILPGTLW